MKKTMLRYDEDQVITMKNINDGKTLRVVAVCDGTYWVWDDEYEDCVRWGNDGMLLMLEQGYVFC